MDARLHPLRAYRLGQDPTITLEDLADRLGTTKASLSRIESGKQQLSEELLRKLVAETGISASALRPDLAKLFMKPPRQSGRDKAAARSRAA